MTLTLRDTVRFRTGRWDNFSGRRILGFTLTEGLDEACTARDRPVINIQFWAGRTP